MFKKILPHLLAILTFYVLTLVYFSPVIEGKKLKQSDVMNFQGMSKEIMEYREEFGEEPLWTSRMFSGMPAYQISVLYHGNLIQKFNTVLKTALLPHPVSIIFWCFTGFYILMMVMGVGPLLGAVASIAFGLSSYFVIIIEAGHNPKGYAIAYMAPVLAGIILTYRGRWLLGAALTALFLSLEIESNHFQITYYLAFIILFYALYELYMAVKSKTLRNYFIASLFLAGSAGLALLPNLTNLYLTSKYTKFTTRGPSELTMDKANKTSGLDRDYATSWSYGIGETFSLLVPNFNGGASGAIGENKKALESVDPQFRQYIANVDSYWGAQPFTSGPVYVGAIVFFLFLLGCFIIKSPLKWWLIGLTVLSIALAWGKNFMPLTDFFFDFIPGYDKFRAVSMTLVIAEFTIPLMAVLAIREIIISPDVLSENKKKFYYAAGISLGLCILFYIMPTMFTDFFKPNEYEEYFGMLKKNNFDDTSANLFMDGIKEARMTIFKSDVMRSLLFIIVGVGLVFMMGLKKMNVNTLIAVLGVFILLDLWTIDKRYLNSDNFVSKSKAEIPFEPSQADLEILKDKDINYRVLNVAANTFNDASTSYFHKSLGGYHGAKLKRYQELIEYQISKNNMSVINMLNAKYFIVPAGESKMPMAQRNPGALGNAWFVKETKIVANADSELLSLTGFDPAKTAVVDQRFNSQLKTFSFDSTAAIKNTEFKPNYLKYEYNSSTDQLAVFSEIYYEDGWNAYLDGVKTDYFRANYVLRAMNLPKGNHTVEFKFEPAFYKTGESIAMASSIALFLLVGSGIFFHLRRKRATVEN